MGTKSFIFYFGPKLHVRVNHKIPFWSKTGAPNKSTKIPVMHNQENERNISKIFLTVNFINIDNGTYLPACTTSHEN